MLDYISANWISILALGISLWVLYQDRIKLFRLTVKPAGRIAIAKNPFSRLSDDCLTLNLIFTNEGAQVGYIEHVALELKFGNTYALFHSIGSKKDRSLQLSKDLAPPIIEMFSEFRLGKGEIVVETILCVPHESSVNFTFSAANYEGIVWVKHSRAAKWQKATTLSFTVNPDDVTELSKTTMGAPDVNGRSYVYWPNREIIRTQTLNRLDSLVETVARINK